MPHIFYPCCIFYKVFGDASVIRVQKIGNLSVGTVIGSRSFAIYWVDSEDSTLIHCLLEPIPDGGNGKAEGIKMAWAKSIVLENPFECNVIVTATMADDRTSKVDWVMSAFQAKGVVFVNSRRAWELDENFEHKESTTDGTDLGPSASPEEDDTENTADGADTVVPKRKTAVAASAASTSSSSSRLAVDKASPKKLKVEAQSAADKATDILRAKSETLRVKMAAKIAEKR